MKTSKFFARMFATFGMVMMFAVSVWSAPPTYQAAGTTVNGQNAITPTWPVHQSDDLALLIVETDDGAAALTTAAGFTAVTNSPQNATGTRLSVFWARATSSNMANPTVADSGNHQIAKIITFRGVIATGNPWDVTAGDTGSSNTSFTIPGATTTVNDTLVVTIVSNGTDTTTAQTSGWTNSNLISLTERVDVGTTSGNGGGFGVATGIKATAGAYGNTAGNLITASAQGRMSIALKPIPPQPPIITANQTFTVIDHKAVNYPIGTVLTTNGTPNAFSINSGNDAGFFKISSIGVIQVNSTPMTVGSYTLEINASNSAGWDTENIQIEVMANRPPVAVDDTVSAPSHTPVSGNVLTNDSDPDGDTLIVTNPGTFTLSFGSITINADGSFNYTPGYFTGETDHYTYTISDGYGGTAEANLIINIASECTTTGVTSGPTTNFCLRKQALVFGDMKTIGNTLVVAPTTQTMPNGKTQSNFCSAINYTTGPFIDDEANKNNQDYYMCSYKPDSNINATSAELDVPAGSTIKWAGLYLQSVIKRSTASTVLGSMDVKIKKVGDATYQSAGTPTVVYYANYATNDNTLVDDYSNYSAFIDVTSVFKNHTWAEGSYTVANVPVTTDTIKGSIGAIGKYGAWSLVVIYEKTDETLRSVSVYDGWKQITGTESETVTASNFYTPTAGNIDAKVAVFVSEGDKYLNGDNFKSGTTTIGTNNNAFNSSVTGDASTRTPYASNNEGIDIQTYNIGTSGLSLLTNGDSSIDFTFSTNYDYYYPSMLAFSTEVYHPKMCYYEDLYSGGVKLGAGAQVAKGSAIQAKVLLKNDMHETAEKVMLYRTFASTLPYTSNSTGYKLNPVAITDTTSPVTDVLSSADIFDYSTPLSLFSLHAGSGATYDQGGDFVQNQTALFDYNTTANFEGNTSIIYQIAYTMPTIGFRYEGELAKCVDFNNTFGVIPTVIPIIGNMDVIETSSYNVAGSYGAANKNIFTKVVKQPFNLEAVYLNTSGNEHVYNGTLGSGPNPKIVNMAVILYTSDTGTCTEERQMIWRGEMTHNTSHVTANIDDVDVTTGDEEEGFTIIKASKDQRVKANFIDYGTLINTATDLTCSTSSLDSSLCLVPACLNSDTQVLKAFPLAQYPYVSTCLYGDGSGNSAPCDSNAYTGSCGGKTRTIGPSKYNNDIGCAMCLADALGMTGCSTDNFAVRPNDFNATITANQQFVAGQAAAITFRANDFLNNGALDYNETEHSSFVVDLNISDSSKNCAEPSISFSPDINFTNGTVTGNYTLGNVGDFNITMHEILNSEYALVDADDTNESTRLIAPFVQPITVIPDNFILEGNLTNGSNGFTYLSNFETYPNAADRNVSALLDFNITARAADNNVTSNYTGNCYAKDGNMTMNLANALVITPAGALSKMIWYDRNHDVNGSISPLAGTVYVMPFFASQFNSVDSNGTADMNYLLNFDRNQTKLVDSFSMSVNSLDAEDNMSVNGSLALNDTVTFVYGRLIPRDVRVFGAVPFAANAWYEVYNVPSINGTGLAPSRNDVLWFINQLHNDSNDGDGSVTVVTSSTNSTLPIIFTSNATGVETYTFSAETPTYSGKAHINSDPWLWYGIKALRYADPGMNVDGTTDGTVDSDDCLHHPCFNINVVPAVGATGSAKSGASDKKASKKSDSGGGTWKSTTDYAPAIR